MRSRTTPVERRRALNMQNDMVLNALVTLPCLGTIAYNATPGSYERLLSLTAFLFLLSTGPYTRELFCSLSMTRAATRGTDGRNATLRVRTHADQQQAFKVERDKQ